MRLSLLLSMLMLSFVCDCNGRRGCDHNGREENRWDVTSPPGERRDIPLDVRSGTWMSLDVSPDGRRIAFDLLGDIYELPIAGGEARALTSGMAWDMQPRYSPDGKCDRIHLRSCAAATTCGSWMRDGAEARQVTKEDFRLLNDAVWHPNGRYLAARKHFTTRARSARARSGCTASTAARACNSSSARPKNSRRSWANRRSRPMARYLYFTPEQHARARSSSTHRT